MRPGDLLPGRWSKHPLPEIHRGPRSSPTLGPEPVISRGFLAPDLKAPTDPTRRTARWRPPPWRPERRRRRRSRRRPDRRPSFAPSPFTSSASVDRPPRGQTVEMVPPARARPGCRKGEGSPMIMFKIPIKPNASWEESGCSVGTPPARSSATCQRDMLLRSDHCHHLCDEQ